MKLAEFLMVQKPLIWQNTKADLISHFMTCLNIHNNVSFIHNWTFVYYTAEYMSPNTDIFSPRALYQPKAFTVELNTPHVNMISKSLCIPTTRGCIKPANQIWASISETNQKPGLIVKKLPTQAMQYFNSRQHPYRSAMLKTARIRRFSVRSEFSKSDHVPQIIFKKWN